MLTLDDLGSDYLNALRVEQGCAKSTFATYQAWLRAFLKWLDAKGLPRTVEGFSTAHLRAYQYDLAARNLRPRTIRAAFHPLRGFATFLIKHQVLPVNPCANLQMPKKDAATRLLVSEGEITALLAAADRLYPSRRRALGRAWLHVLVFSGARFQETLSLRLSDIRLDAGTLLIANGKGGKARTLYPPPVCMEALAQWLAVRGECAHDYVWAYDNRRRVAEQGARRMLEEIKAGAGLESHANILPHSLRHAFASRMNDRGCPLPAIQAALGHTDIKTTAIYLHLGEQAAKPMAHYANLTAVETNPKVAPTPALKPERAQFTRHRRAASRR